MRAPPPVEYPSALTRTWRSLLSLFVGAALASTVAWLLPDVASHWGSMQPDALMDALADPVIQAFVALGLGGALCIVVWLSWKSGRASERALRWDGQDWVLVHPQGDRPDERGNATLVMDLGPWMLVCFMPHAAGAPGLAGRAWLPLSAAGDLARWAALRGALWNWRSQRVDRP